MFIVGDYDQERLRKEIDEVYEELGDMHMQLDDDPIRFGPKRLNGKVAGCKKLVSRCTEIEIHLSTILARVLRQQRTAEAELELLMQDLLASDPEVRAGRSVRDREAIANTKMRDERASARAVTEAGEELKSAITVVKAKKADLKDTQGRLRDQHRLVSEEIALGSAWGTAPPPGMRVSLPREAEAYAQEGKNGVEVLIESVENVMDEVLENTTVEASSVVEDSDPVVDEEQVKADAAQQVLDSLLSEIPEEESAEDYVAKSGNGISADALSGDDLDALIDGDWT